MTPSGVALIEIKYTHSPSSDGYYETEQKGINSVRRVKIPTNIISDYMISSSIVILRILRWKEAFIGHKYQ